MIDFGNEKYADIHLMYGLAEGNAAQAVRYYVYRFQDRRVPDRRTFMRVDRSLRETGSLNPKPGGVGRPRQTRTVEAEEHVLQLVEENASTSVRKLSSECNVTKMIVHDILREQLLHPYHIQKVHAMSEADYAPCVGFCTAFLERRRSNPTFISHVLFTDEAGFTRDGIINCHNMHIWSVENPHAIIPTKHQQRFMINVWMGLFGNCLIGPYIIDGTLNAHKYLTFLQEYLNPLLEEVPLNIRNDMWLMHDGATPHFGRARQGCIHGEELPYLFGAPLVGGFMHFGRNYTKSEVILSEITMIYWSNFARTGNPNEQPEGDHGRQDRARFKNVEWTAYEAVHKKYLNLDQKPKLKNHYRAHRLSFWLNLVPDLHKPGGDDVPASHHELADDDEPPPKLPSLNPRKLSTTEGPTEFKTLLGNGSSVLATVSPADSTERVEELGGISTTQHTVEDGFAAYSTALSVTIAIGCSLLILNVLIFAGVYYQRDKTRMNENGAHQPKKRNENGQMPNNICGDLESSIIGVKGDPATILGHHHSHHQLPPPEFADLPQNNATLPRHPPPPPKINKANVNTLSSRNVQENQPLLSTHNIQLINTGTLTKKNTQMNSKLNTTMEELRV